VPVVFDVSPVSAVKIRRLADRGRAACAPRAAMPLRWVVRRSENRSHSGPTNARPPLPSVCDRVVCAAAKRRFMPTTDSHSRLRAV